MRLWHEDLIPQLPRPQLLGQHRECCALRGNGWGRKHATVDYVFTHSPYRLYAYHRLIMEEMADRGYNVSPEWLDKNYRGKTCPPYENLAEEKLNSPIYSEHDAAYYEECLANLRDKGIELESDMRVAIMSELIQARRAQGISQKKLEELSGVSQPVIARMETGKTSPQLDTVLKVLASLGKTLAVVPLEQEKG